MRIRELLRFVLLIIFLASCAVSLYADAGDLDPTFGGDGIVTTSLGGTINATRAVALQSDGKIVIAGELSVGGSDFIVFRYNPDGTLDTSFSSDGIVTTDFAGLSDRALGVAIQPDGKIIAGGEVRIGSGNADLGVVRYNTDGSLDTTFGVGGKASTDFNGTNETNPGNMVLQPDGKIIVTGQTQTGTNSSDFAMVRFNSDGSLDTTFDFDGKVVTDLGTPVELPADIALQADGKIVVAGRAGVSGATDFAVVRYNTDGSRDSSFDSDGFVVTDFGDGNNFATSVALQGNGKIIVGGIARPNGFVEFGLVRYNSDGSLDLSFDIDGKVNTSFDSTSNALQEVLVQSNGKILALGRAFNGETNDFALARYNSNGSLDSSFNLDGKVVTDLNQEDDDIRAGAIQPDGKIIVAGGTGFFGGVFAVARYEGNSPIQCSLFCDDYEDGVLNPDWTIVKPNWIESGGNLIGTPTGKKAEVIATPAFAGCTNCTMNASMQTAGGEGNKLWFLTWFLDKKNTVEVLMKEENDKWILRQRVNGSVVSKTKGLVTIVPNVFYDVQVNFDGVNFTLIVDGVTLATLPAFASPNGTVGFRVKNTTGQFGFVTIN